jgi:hypothetical protein
MVEWYRGHDTNLSRDVAINVLPAAIARDPDRLARLVWGRGPTFNEYWWGFRRGALETLVAAQAIAVYYSKLGNQIGNPR